MLLAALLLAAQGELDLLGHPDPERRHRAADALRARGGDALPLLLEGRRHADPEVRARALDLLRALSPLAWIPQRESAEALDVLRSMLRSPAPPDATSRSESFLARWSSPDDILREAPVYEQAVLRAGEGDAFRAAEGVIWAGDAEDPPDLLAWLLGHLDDPEALRVFSQLLTEPQIEALLRDPRPEAVDLLLRVYALGRPLDSAFAPRLAAWMVRLDRRDAAPVSVLLRRHPTELAAAMNAGAASRSRWAQYLSAAVGALSHGFQADPAAFLPLLRAPEAEIRREAVRAVLHRIPAEGWDCAALLEAVEDLPERDVLLDPLRLSRTPRLQAAAVAGLRRTPEASLAVLEDCDDPAILDAAVVAFREHPDPSLLTRSTSVLRRMSEIGEDPWVRAQLTALFDGGNRDEGERAAYALGGLAAGEILGFLEERLGAAEASLRGRALLGIKRLGSRVEPDSCLAEALRALLRRRAEVEPDPNLAARLLEAAEAPAFHAPAPHRIRRLWASRGCGHIVRRPSGGWKALPRPSVPLPPWP